MDVHLYVVALNVNMVDSGYIYGDEFLRVLGSQSGVSVWQHTLVG